MTIIITIFVIVSSFDVYIAKAKYNLIILPYEKMKQQQQKYIIGKRNAKCPFLNEWKGYIDFLAFELKSTSVVKCLFKSSFQIQTFVIWIMLELIN